MTWNAIKINGPEQDKYGWTSPEGQVYPPTFSWYYQVVAERSDGRMFYLHVIFLEDEFTCPELLRANWENAMFQLDLFLK